jgi:hypothetical protein
LSWIEGRAVVEEEVKTGGSGVVEGDVVDSGREKGADDGRDDEAMKGRAVVVEGVCCVICGPKDNTG